MNTLPSDADHAIFLGMADDKSSKRDRQITIRLTDADLALMKRAARVAWPGAILSTASVMLSLSRLKAEEILDAAKPKRK